MSTTTRSPGRSSRKKNTPLSPLPTDWPAWQQHLRQRTTPRGFSAFWPKLGGSPLRWGLESLSPEAPTTALIALLERFAERPQSASVLIAELTLWRATIADAAPSWQLGISALAWSHALPILAQLTSPETWNGMLEDLIKLANDAAALQPIEHPLAHQLLAVELPLTLAYLFPELPACTSLVSQARKLWSWAAEEATDGEGLLPARHVPQSKALLACWTRCQSLVRAVSGEKLEEDVQVQFEWLLRQTLRLAREDGSITFGPRGKQADFAALVKAALASTDDAEDHLMAKAALEGAKDKPTPKKPKKDAKPKQSLPEPFLHSEWSNAALLRGSWELGSPRWAVAYDQQKVRCELNVREHVLIAGEWTAEVEIDGWKWQPRDWEEVCWHTDEDVVYLELETKLTDGWKLQRQMMLATREKVMFLADAVLGEASAKIAYRGSLPIAPGYRFLAADETREGYLTGKRAQALVLPLALSEWRVEAGAGELEPSEGRLELHQRATAKRLFAPLWIDLHSERLRKECTWRQLTVAEHLTIQPREVAVAYRVQTGKEQFALYRSLAKKANRTFLGQNVVNEFLAARFKPDGTTETILEIE